MAGAARETSVVEHEVRVEARPETVFDYFTDPVRFVRWMGSEATLDPRPGGVCRIRFDDGGAAMGRFVEVEPGRRIVFTWGWEARWLQVPPQSTRVEVTFVPDGDGTIVRLAHTDLPRHAAEFHRMGWRHYMARLTVAATGADPGADQLAASLRARRS